MFSDRERIYFELAGQQAYSWLCDSRRYVPVNIDDSLLLLLTR